MNQFKIGLANMGPILAQPSPSRPMWAPVGHAVWIMLGDAWHTDRLLELVPGACVAYRDHL